MTQITTRPGRERLNSILVNSLKKPFDFHATDVLPELKIKNDLIDRLNSSHIISIEESKVLLTDRIFPHQRYFITFKLTSPFAKHFVLLRGLLEFGGLKNINLSANRTDKTFHVEISEPQVENFASHIETVLKFLIEEIKFKEGLSELIKFENNVKRKHAILFAKLQSSVQ